MKKTATLSAMLTLVMALFVSTSYAQLPCTWAKKAGAADLDWGNGVAADKFGNVYYLGNFYSQTCSFGSTVLTNQPYQAFNYGAEMFLVKYDSCGNFKWAKQAGGNSETQGRGIAVDAAGNIFVVGFTSADTLFFGTSPTYIVNPGTNSIESFLVKYDPNGVVQWAKPGMGDNQDYAYAVTVDVNNNVYVSGSFGSTSLTWGSTSVMNQYPTFYDVFIGKFDNATGNCQWLRRGTGDYDDYGYGISSDAAGNVYVTGSFGSNYIRFGNDSAALNSYYDVFTVKYDANGNEQWLRVAGGTGNDRSQSIATDASGNSYITGFVGLYSNVNFGSQSVNNTTSSYKYYITKYDANGNNQWARTATNDWYTENRGYNVKVDGAGNPYVIGFYNSDSLQFGPLTLLNASMTQGTMGGGDTAFDAFVVKYKPNGNLQWARTVGGVDHEFGYAIAPGNNYALYICGEYHSTAMTINSVTLTATNTKGNAFIADNINMSSQTPAICLVTTDSTSTNNIVYWDKTPYPDVDSFIVYRETSSGVYSRIGAQPYSALSRFVDTARHVVPANGDPNIGSYRYKLQTLDTAGNLGQMSPYHNTVFFIDNGGGVFTWNTYQVEGTSVTPVTVFNLRRDNNANGNYITIGTVAGTQTTLSDPAYSTYSLTADWRVEAQGFNCTPTMRYSNNGTQGAVVKSKSNITNNRGIGVAELHSTVQLFMYPNPASSSVTIVCEKAIGVVHVLNSLGEIVLRQQSNTTETQLDVSKLPAGMYTVHAQGRYLKLIRQ